MATVIDRRYMPAPKSGGWHRRPARAPQKRTFCRFNMKRIICKDVVGEGADHHTRGRVCSPGKGDDMLLSNTVF